MNLVKEQVTQLKTMISRGDPVPDTEKEGQGSRTKVRTGSRSGVVYLYEQSTLENSESLRNP